MDKKRVLVADHEEKVAKKIKSELEKKGAYEVLTLTKGSGFPDAAKTFHPELIIVDVELSEVSGPQSAWKIMKDEKTKNVPVIFLSGSLKKGQTELFAGIVEGWPFVARPILPRPVHTDDLLRLVESETAKKALFDQDSKCSQCKKSIQYVNDCSPNGANPGEPHLKHYDCDRAARMMAA